MQLICGIRQIAPESDALIWKKKKKSLVLIPRYVFLWRDVLIFSAGDINTMGESKKKRERERKKSGHLNPIDSV